MLELLFKRSQTVERHLSAPLLRERELHLKEKERRGDGPISIQSTAAILLFAVEALDMKDGNATPVSLEEVSACLSKWLQGLESRGRRPTYIASAKHTFISEVLSFLGSCGLLDKRMADNDNVFNKLVKTKSVRIKYFTGPLYGERISFLNHLLAKDTPLSKVKDHIAIQLEVAKLLSSRETHDMTRKELASHARSLCENGSVKSSNFRTYESRFVTYGRQWIRYMKAKSHPEACLLPSLMEDFLSWCEKEKGLSPVTLHNRRKQLKYYVNYMESVNSNPLSPNMEEVEAYLEHQRSSGKASSSISASLSAIRAYLKWVYDLRLITKPIHEFLIGPKAYRLSSLPESAKWEDIQRICGYYSGEDSLNLRNNALVNILAVYGIRSGEAAGLTLDSIDWDRNTITVMLGKVGGVRTLPLVPHIGNLILKYLVNGRPESTSNRLFLNDRRHNEGINSGIVYDVVAKAYKALGIESGSKGGHSIRHALASKLVNEGHTLSEVGGILGHRNHDTTMIYTKVDLQRLAIVADLDVEGLL